MFVVFLSLGILPWTTWTTVCSATRIFEPGRTTEYDAATPAQLI